MTAAKHAKPLFKRAALHFDEAIMLFQTEKSYCIAQFHFWQINMQCCRKTKLCAAGQTVRFAGRDIYTACKLACDAAYIF